MQINRLIKTAVTMLLIVAAGPVATAATLLSQSYVAEDEIPLGSIVSLQKGSTTQVDSATVSNSSNILGVVVDGNSSRLSIASKQGEQVHVATSGTVAVLVSDINGEIAEGDPITASPISGVGMKATANAKIVGVAQEGFPNNTAKDQTYTNKGGQKETVKLGEVPVLVNVTYYFKQPDKTLIPSAIQSIADALAGKKVDPLPILVSVGIFIVTMVIVMSIIYSMIRSSIISVGRNPMSQAAIYHNVIQLSGLVVAILLVGVGSIYMVLTRL